MASRKPLPADDDPLDRLLAEAQWPEAEPQRIARLRQRWFELRRSRAPGPLLSAAIAASLLLASGTACWRWAGQSDPMQRNEHVGEWAEMQTQPGDGQPRHAIEITSRAPTLYEHVLAISARPGAMHLPVRTAEDEDPVDVESLELILRDLADCPGADVRSLAACLPGEPAAYEPALWGILRSQRVEQWEPAVRVLAEIGTWRSLPVLAHWSANPETHHAATHGLARLADPWMLTRLALNEPDHGLRRRLLSGLLDRGTPDAVRLYLNFFRRPETAADALAAARRVDRPPVEQFFAVLRGPDVDARLAAARVLGQFDQPEISQRLARMAIDNVCRQEALVALLSSPRADASLFVRHARQDLSLMAAVRAAEWQLYVFGTRSGGKAS